MSKPNNRAIMHWHKRGSKVVDWEPVVNEFRERKAAKTLADMSIETVADTALYMYAGLKMSVLEVGAHFGTHNAWFNDLVLWCNLTPEAQKYFSIASHVPDLLPLTDARLVGSRRAEKQAEGAQNLVLASRRKKRPRVIGRKTT